MIDPNSRFTLRHFGGLCWRKQFVTRNLHRHNQTDNEKTNTRDEGTNRKLGNTVMVKTGEAATYSK